MTTLDVREIIGALEARALDTGAWPLRDAPLLPGGYAWLEVTDLGPPGRGAARHAGQSAWLRSLAATGTPWGLALHSDGVRTEYHLAVPAGLADAAARLFSGAFPGGRARPADAAAPARLAAFAERAAIAGNPDLSAEAGGAPRLDFVLRAMAGTPWAYVLFARPLSPDAVAADAAALRRAARELVSAHLRPGTAEAENNPEARHALDLLQAALARHEAGMQSGMWLARGYLCAAERAALRQAARAMAGAFAGPGGQPQPFRVILCGPGPADTAPIETALNSLELAVLTQPPDEEFPGMRVRPRVPFALNAPPAPAGPRVALGRVVAEGAPGAAWYEAGIDSLARHALVAGVTGSGKTQTTQFLLSQLWGEHRIPWLVVEPSPKCEYRALLNTRWGGDLRVFTPGNEAVAPLRFNPLEVPAGTHAQQHIDAVLAVFRAGFALVTPMPEVLAAALHACYERHGWDLARGRRAAGAPGAAFPTLSELADFLRAYIPTLGYSPEVTGNLRAGLEMRLRNLIAGGRGLLFDTRLSTPARDLLARPTVLELAALGDNDAKALFMGFLLARLSQVWPDHAARDGGLGHVLVIEEAHRVLRAAPRAVNHELADPRGHAVELFSDLMDEARRFGVGFILVDQSPSRLDAAALRATNLKLAHRLLAAEDRDAMARAMNLRPDQSGHLCDLPPGEAVAHGEGAHGALWVRVPNHAAHHGYAGPPPDDAAVARRMRAQCAAPVAGEVCPGCAGQCPHRGEAARALVDRGGAEAIARAMADGIEAVWRAALGIAGAAGAPRGRRGAVAHCAACQVAQASGADAAALARFARRMRALRDEHTEDRRHAGD